jgi:hypothetical protein
VKLRRVDFPADAGIGKLEQIKIDSLGINVIFVSARTVDLDGKNGIDWNDPTQIIILSPDGKQKNQLTADKFFARTWAVNKLTGTIVITGHYDTNNNSKYDKTDKNEIHIFDLKTFKAITIYLGISKSTIDNRQSTIDNRQSANASPPLCPLPCRFHLKNPYYRGRGKYYRIATSSARNVEFLRNSA